MLINSLSRSTILRSTILPINSVGANMRTVEFSPGYTVSENGVVMSIRYNHTGKSKELKTWLAKGYPSVRYAEIKNKYKAMTVHRLVAQAFIPNPHNKPQVNHIDGNILNNHVSNLEWCTASENQKHSVHVLGKVQTSNLGAFLGATGSDSGRAKAVVHVNTGLVYPTAVEAQAATGVPRRSISRIALNGTKRSKYGERKYV